MKIPGNNPSFWQASPKLVFILSLQLFIASCKAAPAHSQCIRQSVWAERDTDARRISARIDRGDTLSLQCPISCSPGTEVRVRGITGWQLSDRYYTQPANSDGVYSNARAAPGLLTVQPSVHWSGQGQMAHKHALILTGTLHVCWRQEASTSSTLKKSRLNNVWRLGKWDHNRRFNWSACWRVKSAVRGQTIYASTIAQLRSTIATQASFKVSGKLNDVHSDRITQECDPFFILRSTSPL